MNILVDVGGTNIRIAGSTSPQTFTEPIIINTPQKFEEALAQIVIEAHKIATSSSDPITDIIMGLPGILTPDHRQLHKDPHLPEWEGKEVYVELEKALNCRVHIENDAALVGLGEAHFGAGRGNSIVGYITVSTGVGGARIVDGKIEKTAFGFEPGHQIVSYNGETGELESFISGAAIFKKYNITAQYMTYPEVWERSEHMLAAGLLELMLVWSPQCFVLGGSLIREDGIRVSKVTEYLRDLNKTFPSIPEIKHAELKLLGGLYGGLAFLAQQ